MSELPTHFASGPTNSNPAGAIPVEALSTGPDLAENVADSDNFFAPQNDSDEDGEWKPVWTGVALDMLSGGQRKTVQHQHSSILEEELENERKLEAPAQVLDKGEARKKVSFNRTIGYSSSYIYQIFKGMMIVTIMMLMVQLVLSVYAAVFPPPNEDMQADGAPHSAPHMKTATRKSVYHEVKRSPRVVSRQQTAEPRGAFVEVELGGTRRAYQSW